MIDFINIILLLNYIMARKSYRKGSRKGTRSKTRPGHKNYATYKGSKRYSEKRFKRKFGRKTVRAPFFPFAGGSRRYRHYRHRSRGPFRKRHSRKTRYSRRRPTKKSKGLLGFFFN